MTDDDALDDIALPEPRANRPVTLLHRIEYALALGVGGLFRLIGIDAASAIAGKTARAFGPLIGAVSRRADTNFRIAFPDWTATDRRRAVADAWENLGRTAAEFAFLERFDPNRDDGRVEIVNREALDALIRDGRRAVLVSGHFANWEVIPASLHKAGLDYGFVYRAANNPLVDGMIIRKRGAAMSRRQFPKGKRSGRDLIETLKDGRSLAMLVDQKLTTGGVSSPLFGKPALTAPAAARLALKFRAPIIPVSLERLRGARFRMTIEAPIDLAGYGDGTEDLQRVTDLINQRIEHMIRARPGQWLAFHRRWPKDLYR